MAQRGQESHGFPVAMRNLGFDALTARRPTPERGHVGFRPGLVDEYQAGRIDAVLIRLPLRATARDIGPILFGGDQRLFLCVSFSA
jgi:hypothetical protein